MKGARCFYSDDLFLEAEGEAEGEGVNGVTYLGLSAEA
jgi:hypothetical protein